MRRTNRSRVAGARKLRMTLQRLPREITAEIPKAMEQGVKLVQRDAIELAPYAHLKEAMARKAAIGKKSNGFKWEFGFRTKKLKQLGWDAHFVEGGTKPGVRVAKRGKTKKFYGRFEQINHPGTRARPFMLPALEMNRTEMRRLRDTAIKRALKRATRK